MKKTRIVNDGLHSFPNSNDWIADVALFGWECLQGLCLTRAAGDNARSVIDELAAEDDATWLSHCYSPQLFSWLTDAEEQPIVDDEMWRSLRTELRSDQSPLFPDPECPVPIWRAPHSRFLNRLQSMGQGSRSVSSRDAVFLDPESDLFRRSAAGIGDAMRLVRTHVPGFYQDLTAFVRGIVLVDHRASFRGASGLNQCGLIFFSPDTEWSPIQWAEELVHESTHYIVHSLDLRDHLVTGENALEEIHPGPFRPDLRHHHGNFHALCVVSRLVVMFQRFADAGVHSEGMWTKTLDYRKRCVPSYQALIKSATLNPLGKKLFDQWIAPTFTVSNSLSG